MAGLSLPRDDAVPSTSSAPLSPVAPHDGAGIRVLVITNVRLLSDGLTRALDGSTALRVAAVATDAQSALVQAEQMSPDVVLLDISMRDAFEAARQLRRLQATMHVVAFAVEDNESAVLACAESGVAAYVPRSASLSDLMATLEGVVRGEAWCSPRVAGMLFRRVADLTDARATPVDTEASLTTREREIVELIEQGLSNKEIARRLRIGLSTVKNHVHNILEKLRVRRRGEAVAHLRRAGTWRRGAFRSFPESSWTGDAVSTRLHSG